MPKMGLENRGRGVGWINSGTPKQNIRIIFVFLSFHNFYSFFMHRQVYAKNNEGETPLPPCVLRTALFWHCVLRTAIFWPRVLRTV